MTPAEIEQMAREAYNAIGDRFWSQSEIVNLIYKGCMNLFTANLFVIEKTYESSSVIGQKEYTKPSTLYSVRSMTFNGRPVTSMSFEEYATVTGNNFDATIAGNPTRYIDWNGRFILYPTPDVVGTIKVFAYHYPQVITVNSALEIPEFMHVSLVDYVLSRMCGKEKELNALMVYYDKQWSMSKYEFADLLLLKKSSNTYSRVQAEEEMNLTFTGSV